jgi:hypothetical protein
MKKEKKEVKPTKFDPFNITELEAKVVQLSSSARESQKEMYEILEYLRMSGRYKENPGYKKASFWEYLDDVFSVRQGTYRENVRAYGKYGLFAVEYGVGLAAKIDRVCGTIRSKKVMDEISKTNASHKKPISRAKIEQIIQNNRDTKKIEKKYVDWKQMFDEESMAHEKTKAELKAAYDTIMELTEQVEKLKTTAKTFGTIRNIFEQYEETAQQAVM